MEGFSFGFGRALSFDRICGLSLRLEIRPQSISWRGYMNSMFWNLNYWDSVR